VSHISISVPEEKFSVSAIWDCPKKAKAVLVLAHGAGAGMDHPAMRALAEALNEHHIATLRFQFCYMERGSRRPDRPPLAMATVAAAIQKAQTLAPRLPLFAGGKSFGGRMTTNAAAVGLLPELRGIVCFGFPLHPAKKPAITRAEHLSNVKVPTLFIQGTRDDLAELTLMKKVVEKLPRRFKLHIVEGANHSFGVLKSSGRTEADALDEVAQAAHDFCLA
jgi:predicted alpha/beta-hydrolase family hydrolase